MTDMAGIGTQNRAQGHYGERLIGVLAAAGGLNCAKPDPDFGWDLVLGAASGEQLRLQVRTTTKDLVEKDSTLQYPLAVDDYNRLREETSVAGYLAVLHVPEVQAGWTGVMASGYALRHLGRFVSLQGEPPTTNTSTVTVSLPLGNMVTPAALRRLTLGGP